MEFLPVLYAVILVILTIILCVVGVYMITVLMELKRTLQRVNSTLETVENGVHQITTPLKSLGGMATGLGTGMKVFESFVGWLNRSKE